MSVIIQSCVGGGDIRSFCGPCMPWPLKKHRPLILLPRGYLATSHAPLVARPSSARTSGSLLIDSQSSPSHCVPGPGGDKQSGALESAVHGTCRKSRQSDAPPIIALNEAP